MSPPVAVVGTGLVGGGWAIVFARAGHEVSALARGTTLANVRRDGLLLEAEGVGIALLGGKQGWKELAYTRVGVHGGEG